MVVVLAILSIKEGAELVVVLSTIGAAVASGPHVTSSVSSRRSMGSRSEELQEMYPELQRRAVKQ